MADTPKKKNDLDKSINVGMDQFGRFVKLRWLMLVIIIAIIWYFVAYIAPQISTPSPGTILLYAIQISFAILFGLMQFVAIFWFLGRPRLYWVMPGETGVSFADYKGNPEVLESARRIVRLLQGTKEFKDMGGAPVRGLLLSGPPGTGKSYLAQCMSTEAGVPFAYASAASFRAMFIGMDILMIRNLYRKARRLAREYGGCVIFMDEIDAIGGSRNGRQNGMGMGGGMMGMLGGAGTGGLNQLLMEMDPPNIETGWFGKVMRTLGLSQSRVQNEPVLTIGATNIVESLDAALLRPGRFDRKVEVLAPTDKYRGEVIEYYIKKVKYDSAISINALVQRLVNYTPVAIKHVINESVIIAHFNGREMITYKDLVEAQDVHEYGMRQMSELTEIDRRRLAYHEAGHTVAIHYLYPRHFPAYVTVHQRSGSDMQGAAAFAHPRPKETVKTRSQEDMLANIQVNLAARATEELFLNIKMWGAIGDLNSATSEAVQYVGLCAMDGTLISASVEGVKVPKMEERVEAVLQNQYKAVKRLLLDHSEALIAIAEALIERDELIAEEIKEIIEEADAQRVAKKIMVEFEPLLSAGSNGNGHNGNGNGYAVSGQSNGNGTGSLPSPRIEPRFNSEAFDNSDLPSEGDIKRFLTGDEPPIL